MILYKTESGVWVMHNAALGQVEPYIYNVVNLLSAFYSCCCFTVGDIISLFKTKIYAGFVEISLQRKGQDFLYKVNCLLQVVVIRAGREDGLY